MKILIVGGGIVGSYLAEVLQDEHDVTVIDHSRDKYEALACRLREGAKAICEDGCEPWVLEFAGIKGTDLVLAVTGDDEDNLVISYLSKFEYEVPRVIARVKNPKNRWLFSKDWGVDVEVSSPDIIATLVAEEVTLGEVVTMMKLKAGDIGLVEITLPEDAPAVGKSLSDLELPPETLIVSVIREDAMTIPTADTVLQPLDRVLAMTSIQHQEALKRILGHRR